MKQIQRIVLIYPEVKLCGSFHLEIVIHLWGKSEDMTIKIMVVYKEITLLLRLNNFIDWVIHQRDMPGLKLVNSWQLLLFIEFEFNMFKASKL